jgi:solute carrier family 25 protein 16
LFYQQHVSAWIDFVSGGIAGTVAKTAIAPFERVKILFQINSKHYPYMGIVKTISNIHEKEGLLALWRGNMATVVRIFPYAAIQFMTFSQIKQV